MENNTIINIEKLYNYIDCFEEDNFVREKLGLLLDTAFSSPEADSWSANERADVIFVCRQTQDIVKSMFEMRDIITALHVKRSNNAYERRHLI